MSQVSRPMQILLAAVLLFAVAWFVALRPKAPSAGGGAQAPGVAGLSRAVDEAHGAVTTANAAGERAAGNAAASGSTAGATGSTATATSHAKPAGAAARHAARVRTRHATAAHRRAARAEAKRVAIVRAALRHHKAIAIAFVDSSVADARAVADEIRHVSRFHGRALTLAVPISQLSRYDLVTREVQITSSPTTVIVAPNGQASTIVGYTDRVEIQQRLADALAVKR